jgi:OOP family OmpA-OmpF porin
MAAIGGSAWAATEIVNVVEIRSEDAVRAALADIFFDDIIVATDGLQLLLDGEVASESERFRVLSVAGEIVDPDRLIDEIEIVRSDSPEVTKFSLEVLRNRDGISLIGLVPADPGKEAILTALSDYGVRGDVTDLMDAAAHDAPDSWPRALAFALNALRDLPRSKISVSEDEVFITALVDNDAQQSQITTALRNSKPDGVSLTLDISAPRPVVAPFTLRFSKTPERSGFDACTVDSDAALAKIQQSAKLAGMGEDADCRIALGVPTRHWGDAVSLAIASVEDIGGGTISFSDTDVTFVAPEGTLPADFDRVMGELEAGLPEVFSLHAVLPDTDKDGTVNSAPEFYSTLSPEGFVQLRGHVTDQTRQAATRSFAEALFGKSKVHSATRVNPNVPEGWSIRVLAGVEALSLLNRGSLVVREDLVTLSGASGNPDVAPQVTQVFAEKLASTENVRLAVSYDESLDPVAQLPTPEECVSGIAEILKEQQIIFDPGSTSIAEEAQGTIDRIATIIAECPDVPMEIAGHTDSQGREQMNLNLSQSRAEAVLASIMDRRIRTKNLTAKGYGEVSPIADNKTEAGREANRRIEFTLVTEESGEDADTETDEAGTEETEQDSNE